MHTRTRLEVISRSLSRATAHIVPAAQISFSIGDKKKSRMAAMKERRPVCVCDKCIGMQTELSIVKSAISARGFFNKIVQVAILSGIIPETILQFKLHLSLSGAIDARDYIPPTTKPPTPLSASTLSPGA